MQLRTLSLRTGSLVEDGRERIKKEDRIETGGKREREDRLNLHPIPPSATSFSGLPAAVRSFHQETVRSPRDPLLTVVKTGFRHLEFCLMILNLLCENNMLISPISLDESYVDVSHIPTNSRMYGVKPRTRWTKIQKTYENSPTPKPFWYHCSYARK